MGFHSTRSSSGRPAESFQRDYDAPRIAPANGEGGHADRSGVRIESLWAPSIYFVQTGYSIYTLRQASRRSWRIGQRSNVVGRFLTYNETMQTSCLRLMGKKLLISLAMEGKFSNGGLQGIEDDNDVLTAMARELVTQRGVGRRPPFGRLFKSSTLGYFRPHQSSMRRSERNRSPDHSTKWSQSMARSRPWFLGHGPKRSRLDEGLSSSNRTLNSRCSEIESKPTERSPPFPVVSAQQRRRSPWTCFLWSDVLRCVVGEERVQVRTPRNRIAFGRSRYLHPRYEGLQEQLPVARYPKAFCRSPRAAL